jgi:trk system potassium uptake protein TrkH
MGIIVLAVAVMPMLGIGGMQLYKAEAPGPVKDNKLTPRIAETAKTLWYIYLGLTVACAFAYWGAGMNLFDAVAHSFSTVAIGGFSTHDASIGYFDNQAIESVAIFFMFLGAINFALHFSVVRSKSLMPYLRDSEFKFYAGLLIIIAALSVYVLYSQSVYHDFSYSFREGLFQAVSIATTSGFVTVDYASWPVFIPVLLLLSSFIGGCAGSTGGGMKVIRVFLLIKQGQREIMRLIHPNAQVTVKIGQQPVNNSIIDAVWGFFAAYVALFALMMLVLMFNGLDQVTAFSAVAATINNLGPGLGEVSANYASLSEFNKLLLCFSMLLGRLEIFTLLVLFMPAFWRK